MSDLQLALLAIGGVVVAGVYGYNVWQQRRLRLRTEQAFKDKPGDALFGGAAPAASSVERIEPTLASGEAPPPPVAAVAEAADRGAEPDADVECVAEIQMAGPAPADVLAPG
jgi:hypothetical protein